MRPGLRSWKFYVLLACCMGLLGFGLGDGLAHAVRVIDAILSNTTLHLATAQSSSEGKLEKTFMFPTDADGPWPLGRIFADATIVEIGCITHAEVTNGLATGTDANTLADTSHTDSEGATVDFTTLGLDTDGSDQIWNLTDDATCGITGVTNANTLECSGNLSGGNTFALNDVYSIQQNDVTVRVQLYQTTSSGRWQFIQIAENLDCALGETRITTVGGTVALTGNRTLLATLEVLGAENPEWVQVWVKTQ